jgi:uncharacterized membrane protein YccF (DUF307 family)
VDEERRPGRLASSNSDGGARTPTLPCQDGPDRQVDVEGERMRIIGNVLWLLLSGIEMAIAYLLAGLLSIVFIVTIPLAIPAFRLASYTLWPFGRVVVRRGSAGAGSAVANVVWFLVAGWWLALLHLFFGLLLAITVIGIPFAVANLKLAKLALTPYGKDVIDARDAHGEQVVVATPQPLGADRRSA